MMVFVCLFVCDDGGAHYRDAFAKNAWQVHRYLLEYNGGHGGGRFNDARLSECLQLHTLSGQLHNRSLEDAGRERLTIVQAHICSMPLAAVIFEPPAETCPNLPPPPPPPPPRFRYVLGTGIIQGTVEAHQAFLTCAANLARDQWTQFSMTPMVVGILLLFAVLLWQVNDW